MKFNDDECYRLLLAVNLFVEEYHPTTSGEQNHLDKTLLVQQRLRDWHNDFRSRAST